MLFLFVFLLSVSGTFKSLPLMFTPLDLLSWDIEPGIFRIGSMLFEMLLICYSFICVTSSEYTRPLGGRCKLSFWFYFTECQSFTVPVGLRAGYAPTIKAKGFDIPSLIFRSFTTENVSTDSKNRGSARHQALKQAVRPQYSRSIQWTLRPQS
jgi:hypothetical protein